jgi:hypothetical protein
MAIPKLDAMKTNSNGPSQRKQKPWGKNPFARSNPKGKTIRAEASRQTLLFIEDLGGLSSLHETAPFGTC